MHSSSSAVSVFLVLSLGAFCGGIVKGITGFGNAILNLLVWVAFTAGGVDAGPLQMAVLADSLGCVVCSIPLLVMTSAHKTADCRLVLAILIFSSAGAPLGAALLKYLPARWVELAMACVLLLVICIHVKLHEKLGELVNKLRSTRVDDVSMSPADDCLAQVSHAPAPLQGPAACLPSATVLSAGANTAYSLSQDGSKLPNSTAGLASRPGAHPLPAATKDGATAAMSSTTLVISCCGSIDETHIPSDTHIPSSQLFSSTDDGNACVAQAPEQNGSDEDYFDPESGSAGIRQGATSDTQPLLGPGILPSATVPGAAEYPGSGAGGTLVSTWVSPKQCIGARLRRWLERQDMKEAQRILLFGSVAGFTSGVMGGMTGIGGPPLMFLYEKLKVAKEVVRGTNAVNNVLQMRLISYIVMGVFKREDMMLYAVTSSVGLAGVVIGNCLAGRLDQKGFSRVLVALMVICCLLLFASAAGLKGRGA